MRKSIFALAAGLAFAPSALANIEQDHQALVTQYTDMSHIEVEVGAQSLELMKARETFLLLQKPKENVQLNFLSPREKDHNKYKYTDFS